MRQIKKIVVLSTALAAFSLNIFANDYSILNFGANNDGATLNTNIIQGAIDYLTKNGGGRLVFDSGVYLTGSFYLKSNVTIHLMKSAELRSSGNPFDFKKDKHIGWTSMIFAFKQHNIGITGAGVINGIGFITANKLVGYVHTGIINDPLNSDRVREVNRPTNIYFWECNNVTITGITLKDPASWNQVYNKCKSVYIHGIHVDAKAYWNSDGVDIVDCEEVVIKNSFFDTADDALCFKSYDTSRICRNVILDSCIVRSSASGLKFGAANKGGFQNFKVTNLKIYDTYRSAIALESVDGGIIDQILIDGVDARNVGNVIFLRIGNRENNGRVSSLTNVTIRNIYAEVTASKADAGYTFEGPIEDLPRNVSPSIIAGLPQRHIRQVKLSHIEIVHPGGGNPHYAKQGAAGPELESIPERPHDYPEFSKFRELPAWGFYVRHADQIEFNHITLKTTEPDYRPAIVFDDVKDYNLKKINISEPREENKENIVLHNSVKRTNKF